MKSTLSLEEIERAIAKASPARQRRLLKNLPRLLKIAKADLAFLKVAENSFDFWNNPEDAIYDRL